MVCRARVGTGLLPSRDSRVSEQLAAIVKHACEDATRQAFSCIFVRHLFKKVYLEVMSVVVTQQKSATLVDYDDATEKYKIHYSWLSPTSRFEYAGVERAR